MFSFLFSFDLRPPASLVAFFFLKAALLAALFVILSYMLCAFMSPRPNLVSATAEVLRDDTKEQIELEAHLYRSLAINCQEKARLTDALINLPQSKAAYRLGATTDLAPSYAVVLSQGMAGLSRLTPGMRRVGPSLRGAIHRQHRHQHGGPFHGLNGDYASALRCYNYYQSNCVLRTAR